MRFSGKNVFITGAAGGIGSAIANAFCTEGAFVVVSDTRVSALERVRNECPDPSRFALKVVDVTIADEARGAIDESWEEQGGLDILVNCAGLYPSDPVLRMSESRWDAVLDTNLKGPFLCSQAFARRAVSEKECTSIINITSGSSRTARLGAAHYCASKAGLEMLTRALALELGPHGIRVNAVSPGFVKVDSEVNPTTEEYTAAISAGIPLGRAGVPPDITGAALFLCTEEARWITGASLAVDGGLRSGNANLPLSQTTSANPLETYHDPGILAPDTQFAPSRRGHHGLDQ